MTPTTSPSGGAFLVGIALSGPVAHSATELLPALALALVTMATKTLTGYLAVAASAVHPKLAPLAAAYVLITVITGPMLARLPDYAWSRPGHGVGRWYGRRRSGCRWTDR